MELHEAGYFVALEGVTKHGLSEACRAILRGRLGHAFYPSPPELRLQCDEAMKPHRWHRDRERREMQYINERRENNAHVQRSPAAIARQQKAYKAFTAGYEADKLEAGEAERAEIRARYGITDEAVAHLPDLEIPSNFETPSIRSKS
ncbi:hypothetical protein [Mesorhizobium sp. Pch-S]|uniref:hypothetical protein n=1 Tax=Mesorhizobium sp. Pch-S TaxID=2082387 RepID=UPI0013EE17C2|nr:hypothetical protein [Mesorhizobium sp. Pch-S]